MRNTLQNLMLLLALVGLGFSMPVMAQVTISGQITDADTGEALLGANIVLEGTTMGTAADAQGRYNISGVSAGTYNLTVSFVGYQTETRVLTVGTTNLTVNVALMFANEALEALEVFASRAIDRETPVAYSNVTKMQIQRQLGSRDIPLVLNTTPSVYATAQGGGAGDARVNVRGFNQRNVAVMINGVPVNDMENGWVYWSNWDGVGDATSSIQLQRGLSAVNLATPSIGGTLNILTDPSAMSRQVKVKQEVGNDGFFKTTAVVSTGLVNGKYGLTVAGVRKKGDGLVQGTWTDAWAYYVAASYNVNTKNRIDFYALGAPQRHGQNLYRQNIAVYDRAFAEGLGDYDPAAFDKYHEAGREWNQNVASVSSSYNGEQAVEDQTFSRFNSGFLNERENFFHKPQVNLNWYSQLSEKLLLSTVAYYSGGRGGGTGTLGSLLRKGYDSNSTAPWFNNAPWIWDWDATIERNRTNSDGARGILRNSRNNQWTIGAISKLALDVNDEMSFEFGLDWRTAEIEHYREVRDLLGGDYYNCDGSRCGKSDFWSEADQRRGLGDKIDYDFTNTVDWFGTFLQGEYKTADFSTYGMVGLSTIKYGYTNFFRDGGNGQPLTAETDNILGYQVKGGVLYNASDQIGLFSNVGIVSKVPIFDGVIDDRAGFINTDPSNEKFISVEAGATFRSITRAFNARFNVYSTTWNDRTFTRGVTLQDGSEGLINLTGLDALHKGIEAEVAYQPFDMLRFDGAASIGNWKYTNDVSGSYRPDGRAQDVERYNFYVDNLKVGDAPQTQFALGVSVFPVDGLSIQAVTKAYARHYADFDPFSRTDVADRVQSWRAPSYTLVDLHVGYDLPLQRGPLDIRLFANVFNALDELYIQDALDNSRFNAWDNDHDADDAEVFFGLPRTFNIGTTVTF